jgi:AbrB family looped-hinge helix DNA binding protein
METATLSSKFQLVIPRRTRERLGLRPGTRMTVLDKGGVIYLVPERAPKGQRGIARGTTPRALRDKKDRL